MIDQACVRCADRFAECTECTVDQCLACNTSFVLKEKQCAHFTYDDKCTAPDDSKCVKCTFLHVREASGDGCKTRPSGG